MIFAPYPILDWILSGEIITVFSVITRHFVADLAWPEMFEQRMTIQGPENGGDRTKAVIEHPRQS